MKKRLNEEPAKNKPKTATDIVRDRQKREKMQLQNKQARELAAARTQDFRTKENQKRSAEQKKMAQQRASANESSEFELDFGPENENIYEYLEDGTYKLVKTYKKDVPGQDI